MSSLWKFSEIQVPGSLQGQNPSWLLICIVFISPGATPQIQKSFVVSGVGQTREGLCVSGCDVGKGSAFLLWCLWAWDEIVAPKHLDGIWPNVSAQINVNIATIFCYCDEKQKMILIRVKNFKI